jgi:pimeloyl-ACP methyl ester carboxylesterase
MNNPAYVTHAYARLDEVTLHYVTAGSGPPVVLLHGWPQTWYEWRHIIPALAQRYTIIAPDLRGLGDSSRPQQGYDKQTMARDIWQLVNGKLGHDRFFLAGHDWGGPTAFALATQQPQAVRRLAIIDVVIPGDGGDFSQGGRRWHHQFHITPDLPEAMTLGREDVYLAWFYRTLAHRPNAVGGLQPRHPGRHEAADAGAGCRRCRSLGPRERGEGKLAARGGECARHGGARLRALYPGGAAGGPRAPPARFLC